MVTPSWTELANVTEQSRLMRTGCWVRRSTLRAEAERDGSRTGPNLLNRPRLIARRVTARQQFSVVA
jgi:hypothetical protein